MPCLLGFLALAAPRFVLVLVFLFSGYLGRAYDTALWPLLGFLFLPTTTLAYAFALNEAGSVRGLYFGLVVIALLVDLSASGYGLRRGRGRGR